MRLSRVLFWSHRQPIQRAGGRRATDDKPPGSPSEVFHSSLAGASLWLGYVDVGAVPPANIPLTPLLAPMDVPEVANTSSPAPVTILCTRCRTSTANRTTTWFCRTWTVAHPILTVFPCVSTAADAKRRGNVRRRRKPRCPCRASPPPCSRYPDSCTQDTGPGQGSPLCSYDSCFTHAYRVPSYGICSTYPWLRRRGKVLQGFPDPRRHEARRCGHLQQHGPSVRREETGHCPLPSPLSQLIRCVHPWGLRPVLSAREASPSWYVPSVGRRTSLQQSLGLLPLVAVLFQGTRSFSAYRSRANDQGLVGLGSQVRVCRRDPQGGSGRVLEVDGGGTPGSDAFIYAVWFPPGHILFVFDDDPIQEHSVRLSWPRVPFRPCRARRRLALCRGPTSRTTTAALRSWAPW